MSKRHSRGKQMRVENKKFEAKRQQELQRRATSDDTGEREGSGTEAGRTTGDGHRER